MQLLALNNYHCMKYTLFYLIRPNIIWVVVATAVLSTDYIKDEMLDTFKYYLFNVKSNKKQK